MFCMLLPLVFVGPVDDVLVAACLDAHRGYRRHLSRLAGTVRADSPNNRVDDWYIRRFYIYEDALCHHSWLDTTKTGQSGYFERVLLNNPRYSVRVTRNMEKDVMTVRGIGPPTKDIFNESRPRLSNSLWAPIMLRERLLDEWLKTPGFRITGATRADNLVSLAVTYENSIKDTKETYECPFSGTVRCDPSREYRIVDTDLLVTFRFSGSPDRQRRLITKCEYDTSAERYSVPKRVTIAVENDAGIVEPHSTWYVSDVEPVKAADQRFTLSYYGLPEPFGVEWERPTPWWLYIGGTLGLIAVLILISWIRRWRAARQAAV